MRQSSARGPLHYVSINPCFLRSHSALAVVFSVQLSLVQLNCKQAAVAPDGQQEIKQGYYIRRSLYPAAAAATIHQTPVAEREEAVIVKLNGIQRNKKKSEWPPQKPYIICG